jgi:hypothetical protein
MIPDIIVKTPFFGYPLGEFKGWGRFCHVVYPAGKPEDFRSIVVKDSW